MSVHPRPLPHPPRPTLHVGFLCPHNPHDPSAFSGTAHFAAAALDRAPGVRMRLLGPHRRLSRLDRVLRRRSAAVTADGLDLTGLDAVVGLVATDLLDGLRDRIDIPFLHVTDATPRFLRDTYGWTLPVGADAAEARVIARAARVVYSSDEMAARARSEFGAAVFGRTRAVPFGVNLAHIPATAPLRRGSGPLRLIFVARDWDRKGGDLAVATLDRLRAAGQAAELTVVGPVPRAFRGHPGLRLAGSLDKARPREAARLSRLYGAADLMLLPTRADCTPMVVAEAMAHGTPVLATRTGGMATLLGQGGGRMMDPEAGPADWAAAVRDLAPLRDAEGARGRAVARRRLSWEAWGREIADLLAEVTGPPLSLRAAAG